MAHSIKQLMQFAVDNKASDIHLSVGRPPTFRIGGKLKSLKGEPMTPSDTIAIFKEIAPERSVKELQEAGSSDFAYEFEDYCRFRTAAFMTKGVVGIVLRQIPVDLMSFDEIGLPESLTSVLDRPRGLVLVTGPTGSGKTTTLATCIDYINTHHDHHIITVEDPIEFYHPHKKSIVTQRELGVDVETFSEGLRRALRQDPDVILVGEMRDLDTIAAAITAAETGHLVFGTLHTTGATRTVDRIIDAFPSDQQEQIRAQLAVSIAAVISQVLCPRVDGGMVAAFEILYGSSAVENLIREGKTFQLQSIMQTSKHLGMLELDEHLWELWKQGEITRAELLRKSQDRANQERRLKEFRDSGKQGWDDHREYDYGGNVISPGSGGNDSMRVAASGRKTAAISRADLEAARKKLEEKQKPGRTSSRKPSQN